MKKLLILAVLIAIGVVAARRKRLAQAPLQQALGQAEFQKKVLLVARFRVRHELIHL